MQEQATQEQEQGCDRSQATLSTDLEMQDTGPALGATNDMSQQATSALQESLKRREEDGEQLDAIGLAMLSWFDQRGKEEQEAFLKLAHTSPTEMVQELRKRYPGYASFFTKERIAGIVQALIQRSAHGELPEKQAGDSGEYHSRLALKQGPGYGSGQQTHKELSDNLRAEQDSNSGQQIGRASCRERV